ncbi:hypothetical protein [Kitasatospora fiedleri]|uniref:hypothetical protein n=1 Tax=Kitasatospora fiedleri TaxID=2991545 RepID=UPI00249BFC24|nr:hypothetical protein [Kitasatospora fiedleri]
MGLLFLAASAVTGFLLSRLALRLVGIRPAWRVVAVAVLLFWLAGNLYYRVGSRLPLDILLPLASTALFALAAVLTAPRPPRWRPRIALLLVLALCWPLSALLGEHQADERLRDEITGAGVPLYAPDLTDYRLHHPLANQPAHWFGFTLLPARPTTDNPDDTADTADADNRAVRVTVQPVRDTFRPPLCDALDLGSTVRAENCEQVTPDTWRQVGPYTLHYFVRRGDYLIVMSADSRNTTTADLQTLTSTLTERTPDYFLP